jgi:SpoVK/Ycf46/Vps4 family AAA+-type ATPase
MAPWLAVLVQLSLASAAFHTPVRGDIPFPLNKCLGSHLASSSSPSETSTNQHKDENEQVVRNSHYIQGLLDNLTHALDRWIITGSKAPQERAKNILQQIRREAMDAHAVEKAELMAQRAGINPIVSNSLAMKKELGKTDGEERRKEAERRKEWEAQRTSGQDVSKQGRSALSRRSGDIMMGTVDSNLESFANSKTELQSTLQRQQTVSDYSLQEAATKSSELVALAGAGGFDGETMGIGGLDGVLGEIKRRIWVPLAAPPALLEDLGIHPVRGLLLYGKPGCGKTLLARKVGHILSPSRPVTVVSGPELMDKFVGSSEKVGNVRVDYLVSWSVFSHSCCLPTESTSSL